MPLKKRTTQSPLSYRALFYKLVNATNGEPLTGTTVDAIKIHENAMLFEVRDAIYAKNSQLLTHLAISQLQVYENEASFTMSDQSEEREPLSPGTQIGSFGISDKSPIIIAVPSLPPTVQVNTENPKKIYLYLSGVGKISKKEEDAAYSYSQLAKRILDDSEAKAYIDALWEKFKEGRDSQVFNALCVPSGTGKTQLAFALPQDQCACIYLNMDVSSSHASAQQPVYGAFRGYMVQFIRWLKEDYREDSSSGYRLYGFVYALIQLLIEHPELELPSDLSRLVISDGVPPGLKAYEVRPKLLGTVQFEEERLTKLTGKDLVFFIDEFAFSSGLDQEEQLAFLRRTLMDIGSCVIVASTDSGALNMFNTAAATAASRGNDNPWVQLFTQLPKYVPDPELRSAISLCNDSAVKVIFTLCIESRPLFAETVVGRIRTYLCRRNTSDIMGLLEQMREDLSHAMRQKISVTSTEGCFGYVMAMLLAGGALISGDESRMRIYGNLTTKSWAYLVHDPSVFTRVEPDPQHTKRSRLESTELASDRFMRMTIRSASPSFLILKRFPGPVRTKDVLYYHDSNSPGGCIFSCTSFFPDPREDFLLYLVLAGSKAEPGLRVAGSASGSTQLLSRISVAKLVNFVFAGCRKLPSSVSDLLPSFAEHEAVVCAAFYTACNAGGLSGCSLEELVTRFVAELAAPRDCLYPQLGTVEKIPWSGEFTARFAFPFDTELPIQVHDILKSVQTMRPPNSECVDAVTYTPNKSGQKVYEVLVEAKASTKPDYVKSRIEKALKRQDANAKISFIVVDKNVDENVQFDTSKYQCLDRSKKVGREFAKGDTLEARVFLVDLDKSKNVILKAIDGQSNDAVSDRVIFVLDVKRINDHFRRLKK